MVIALSLALLFWPTPVDAPSGPLHYVSSWLFSIIGLTQLHYFLVEKGANLLMFTALGYIAEKHTTSLWLAFAIPTTLSVVAEFTQKYILTNRVFAIDDMVANAIGAGLGVVVHYLVDRAKTRRRKK